MLAAALVCLGFPESRIRQCCDHPEQFREVLEDLIPSSDSKQQEDLRQLWEELYEDADAPVYDTDFLAETILLLCQMKEMGAVGFATVDLRGLILCIVVSLLVALLLRPVLADWIRTLFAIG